MNKLITQLDPRIKLIFILLGLIGCVIAKKLAEFVILAIPILVGFTLLRNKRELILRAVVFIPLIIVTCGLQLLFTPGRIITKGMTYEGLYNGIILGIRVSLAVGYSLIFISSTSAIEIAKSLDWITKRKLKLGEIVLITLQFIKLIKDGSLRYKSPVSILNYAIERTKNFTNSLNAKHQN
ncbi:MAG: energy-coupling factor transporter transmembrane component T [bacterium]|nr:energy-coupling factor transporter transmembrane component T [bacterium]